MQRAVRGNELSAAAVIAAGILGASLLAARAGDAAWALSAPVLLALSILLADMCSTRRAGAWQAPRPTAVVLGAIVVLVSLILSDPHAVASFMPILGAAGWVGLQRNDCSLRTARGSNADA